MKNVILKSVSLLFLSTFFIYGQETDRMYYGGDPTPVVPLSSGMMQNYPNPFNPVTNFVFQFGQSGDVQLKIFDALGRNVSTVVNEYLEKGEYIYQWNANNLPSGIYYYRIIAPDFTETKRMILLK